MTETGIAELMFEKAAALPLDVDETRASREGFAWARLVPHGFRTQVVVKRLLAQP